MMRTYRRVAVASTFSPTFEAVLAEAESFARHVGPSSRSFMQRNSMPRRNGVFLK